MKIYLLDINKNIVDAWKSSFKYCSNVEVIHESFENFMNTHQDIDAVVSPANSFGLMDGGYDKAITLYFGKELMRDVQDYIIDKWYGEQPVGTSFSIPIKNTDKILIHTPSMRTPEVIEDPRIIYQCMRTTLIEAFNKNVENIVIPAFGGLTGKVEPNALAYMMKAAYDQVFHRPDKLNWGYAWGISNKLIT